MTEDQFERFIKSFSEKMDMREMFIRIDENLKYFRKEYNENVLRTAAELDAQKKSVSRAHERIDSVRSFQQKSQWMLAGAVLLGGFLMTVAQFLLDVYRNEVSQRPGHESPLRHA